MNLNEPQKPPLNIADVSGSADSEDFNLFDENGPVYKMVMRLPFCCDWVEYKGETVVAQINYEATIKAKKPMMDISYCMTRALNQNILYTTQYDKSKFKPSRLGMARW
jgi:hypothetical protein